MIVLLFCALLLTLAIWFPVYINGTTRPARAIGFTVSYLLIVFALWLLLGNGRVLVELSEAR